MPKITVLPHATLCPEGAHFEVAPGISVCNAMLQQHIPIEHACEQSCACTTCHVIVREGYGSLGEVGEEEDDLLDKAWGLTPCSRLSCQAIIAATDLTIELPRYTLNHAREQTEQDDWEV